MSKFVVVSILLCALAWGSCEAANKMKVFRLPDNTKPVSYELQIVPNITGIDSTFTGQVKIEITVHQPTKSITLNLKDLTVTAVSVNDIQTKRTVDVVSTEPLTDNEQFQINLKSYINAKRNYLVTIAYTGKIRNDLSGFYLSSYNTSTGTKWLAVTQFEPTYARRAFPCYDEPSFKAVFNLSVAKPKNMIALSNMPAYKTDVFDPKQQEMEIVYFNITPPMSSYLLAFFVGDFVANKNDDVAVYTYKDYLNQTGYASTEAPKHLNALTKYLKIDTELSKLDLLAIPDFSAGAMENWGINTYRERFLLLHNESKSIMKIRSSVVIQHEFTHNWFGDLVTCAWWDYLWLNEGFARYFQYFATAMVRPNWKMEELFVVETHQNALAYDQTPRQPITSSVNTIAEIENKFDIITYSKAASVIRMLKYLVTEKLFRSSLQQYLNDNKFDVVEPNDLYTSFDSTLEDNMYHLGNDLNVYEFMSNWTTQPGYPILDIKKNETTNQFSIIQSRFLINDTMPSAWHIGLTYTTETSQNFDNFTPSAWTNKMSNMTVIPASRNSGWYIFNIQSTGFYRVNYDTDNWKALINQLNTNHTKIHVLNRAQLLDDAFTLARAGRLDYTVPLELSKYLKNETSVIPWYPAMKQLSFLMERMPRNKTGYESFKAHASRLAGFIYTRLENLVSKGNSEFSVKSAWDTFSSWACKLDNVDCKAKAMEYFKKWQNGEKISADIKDAAFCIGVKNSTCGETFNRMFNLYTKTMSISERESAELALGCSANRTQLTEYVNHIFDGPSGPLKAKKYASIISAVSVTPLGLDVLYELLSNKLNNILNEVPDGENIVKHIYSTLASKITNDKDIENLRKFKENSNLTDSVRSSFDRSFDNVNDNLLWFNKYSVGISQWGTIEEAKEEAITVSSTTEKVSTVGQYSSTSTSSKPTPKSTSSAPMTGISIFTILQLTVLTILIKTYIL